MSGRKFKIVFSLFCAVLFLALHSCREDELLFPAEQETVPVDLNTQTDITGIYLLNEGNMGSNKSTLDFLDFRTGIYSRNIFPEKNPNVVKEMGDVGNDLQIYGSKLYVVLNASHKVDVLDLLTAKKITQIDIPNCRFIRFHEGKAYVSSYAGPIAPGSNAPLGAVYKIDTTTFRTETEVTVGYQPEEMEIIGKYLFVANSGGYMPPKYDNTVSVIDLDEFKQIRKIPVGINLHRIRADKYGKLWVSSMGNREKIPSMLFVLEKLGASGNYAVTDSLDIPCSNFAIRGDSLFLFSVKSDFQTGKNQTAFGIINVKTKQLISENFIFDGTGKEIEMPYGLALHPENGDIFITDAKNYVSSGELHCYDKTGKRKWSVRTGDIPAHIAFVNKGINNRR